MSVQERDLHLYKSLITASKILNDKARTHIKDQGLTFENLLVIECLFEHGPHYIQTLSEKLPDGFQTSEYLLEHGFIDSIVPRTQLKKTLAQLISLHQPFYTLMSPLEEANHHQEMSETL